MKNNIINIIKNNIIKIAIIFLFTSLPLTTTQLTKKQRNDIIGFISNYEIITKECDINGNLSICTHTLGSTIKGFMSLFH